MKLITAIATAVCLVNLCFGAPAQTPAAKKQTQTRCHVHKQPLKHEWVKIEYGLIYLDKDFIEARLKLFPFSNKTWGGGCVITNRSPKFKKVDCCDKCRSAEWLWKRSKTAAS